MVRTKVLTNSLVVTSSQSSQLAGVAAVFLCAAVGCSSGSSKTAEALAAEVPAQGPKASPPRIVKTGAAPIVNTRSQPEDPLLVSFGVSNPEDYDESLFAWRFGDGNGSDEAQPEHRYETGGVYFVRLSYLDQDGENRLVEWPVDINTPPTVVIEDARVLPGTEGMGVWLEASATDPETAVHGGHVVWNLGDETTTTGDVVEHVFENEGVFQITATVTDADGAVSSDRLEVEVVRDAPATTAPASAADTYEPAEERTARDVASAEAAAEEEALEGSAGAPPPEFEGEDVPQPNSNDGVVESTPPPEE